MPMWLLTAFLLVLLAATVAAWVVALMHEKGIRPVHRLVKLFRDRSKVGRCVLGLLFVVFGIRASEKFGGGLRSSNLPVEDGWENMPPITSTNTTRTLEADDFRRGFVLARVGTDEAFAFDAPSGAVVCADWRAFGAAEDWAYVATTNWAFDIGTNEVDRLRVFSAGKVDLIAAAAEGSLATNIWFAPFAASLGIVPETNWQMVGNGEWGTGNGGKSQFWHFVTPSNTLQMTWQNVLMDRDTNTPVSVQAEFWPNGRFAYRYDLSRCGGRGATALSDGTVTNALVGACFGGLEWTTNSIPTNVTSFAFHPLFPEDAIDHDRDGDGLSLLDELFAFGTDPDLADTDRDGLADSEELAAGTDPLDAHSIRPDVCDGYALAMGGLDPLAVPEGSTNTVLEHLFYTGTTNGTISLPQPSETHAVLSVAVSGHGTGRLAVGDRVVPLFLPEPTRSGPPPSCAYACPVPRGQDVPVFLCADGTLSVAFDSSEFTFGTLPSIGGGTFTGFLNFPNTVATTPCIHDFNARDVSVSLPVGQGASLLQCAWTGTAGVGVANSPPRAAMISGDFSPWQTRSISYELSHPQYLFGQTHYQQTVRFCPQPSEPEDEEEVPPWYEEGEGYASDGSEDDDGQTWHLCGCVACGDDCACGCRPPGIEPEPGGEPGGEEEEEDVCPEHEVPYSQCAHLHEAAYTNAVQSLPPLSRVLYIRDPLDWHAIQLEVPTEPRRCCPCPDHWQNYVEVSYKSRDLRLVDGAGLPFRRAGESCTVRVAGAVPSSTPGDAWLAFSRNGEDYLSYRYTVLGVAIRSASGPPLSSYGTENPSFGFPVAVATNTWDSPQLRLVTNVGLGVGNVRVSLENATGDFALWRVSLLSGGYRKLLDTSGSTTRAMPMQGWRQLIYDAGLHGAAYLPVFVTSSSAGHVDLVLRYWTEVGGCFVEDEVRQRITSVNPPLMADIDRDGAIGDGDIAAYLGGKVFRFWTNEDVHKGDYVGQVADTTPNAADLVVNGRLDLVNLFPVKLSLKPLIAAWPSATFRLRAGNNRLRFCGVDVSPEAAGTIQMADIYAKSTSPQSSPTLLSAAALTPVTNAGVAINPAAYLGGNNAPGVLAFEAANEVWEGNSPELLVDVGGETFFRFKLPMKIDSVRKMYRWANIRSACGDTGGETSQLNPPLNFPDEDCDGRHFVFVHGYNVNPAAAREWADAMFKRLWWSGSKSMFTAVDWHGDDSQFATLAHGDVSPDYYANVMHAFASASALASRVASLPGTEKVLLAHSLGNIVVSSAIKDHDLSGYSKYYMLNAAVPMEAYDANANAATMVDQEWALVPTRYRASDWNVLFPTNDFRSSLSWRGRFSGIPNAVNCYSESEDVLGNPSVGQLTFTGGEWKMQELTKGTTTWHELNTIPFLDLNVACEGGWGINTYYALDPTWYIYQYGFTDKVQTNMTDQVATEHPLFTPFRTEAEAMHSTNLFVIVDASYKRQLRAKFLADAIPATSFAAGANLVQNGAVSGNIDYETCKTTVWPRAERKWWHSDIKNVAYFYTRQLFQRIKNNDEGDTNEP